MRCERLEVWKRSCRLSVNTYKAFAESKDYGFKDQITRSSLSIASNIAEGMEKDTAKDKKRFLGIAKGSAAELITQFYIAIEIGYISKENGIAMKNETEQILKMLQTLQTKLNTER